MPKLPSHLLAKVSLVEFPKEPTQVEDGGRWKNYKSKCGRFAVADLNGDFRAYRQDNGWQSIDSGTRHFALDRAIKAVQDYAAATFAPEK